MRFAQIMATVGGRVGRVILGLGIMVLGFGVIDNNLVGVLGILPILAGTMNFCTIAPLIGAPFRGRDALAARPDVHVTRDAHNA